MQGSAGTDWEGGIKDFLKEKWGGQKGRIVLKMGDKYPLRATDKKYQ